MSVFELPTVTLIPNGIHHPPIEDGRLLPNSVKMPLYPFSNYLVFLYMAFVCVVLFLGKDTRIALLLTPVWFLLLLLIYHMKYERKK
ncbi:hypothetical protein GBM61_00790 [Enterococcus faecium]|nr:hypothetical protein GBM61_00790 [Enterococcus faecium]